MNTLSCPECKKEISHENPMVLKRMLARHLSVTHGIPGTSAASVQRHKKQAQAQAGFATAAGGPGTTTTMAQAIATLEEKRKAEKRAYYLAHREEILRRQKESIQRRRAGLPKLTTRTPLVVSPQIQEHYEEIARDNLQKSSWWQSQDKERNEITCPCCRARFVIIEGSQK